MGGTEDVTERMHVLVYGGGAVGLGSVENEDGVGADYVKSGSYEILVAGVRYTVRASLRPMYDPEGERVRS